MQRVLIAGLGAMVVLRGRLLSVAGPGDTKTDIGFAPLVEAILAAVNRSIDRGRAHERMGLVPNLSRAMAPLRFRDVSPHLKTGLQALQTLEKDVLKEVLANIEKLEQDGNVSDAARFEAAGYDPLNNFGEKCFRKLFEEAKTSARKAANWES